MDSGYPLFFLFFCLFSTGQRAGGHHRFPIIFIYDAQSSILYHPSATSSIIINANPTANPMVPIFECSPSAVSGISSSTTTYIMAPAAKARRYGRTGARTLYSSTVKSAATGSTTPERVPYKNARVAAHSLTLERQGNDRALREVLDRDPDGQGKRTG